MFSSFLGKRGQRLDNLVKQSVAIMKNETDLLRAAKRLVLMMLFRSSLFVLATASLIFCLANNQSTGLSFFIYCAWVLSKAYTFYYEEKIKAAQSWLTYNTLKNNDLSLTAALKRAEEIRGTVTLIALVNYLFRAKKPSASTGVSGGAWNSRNPWRSFMSPTGLLSLIKSLFFRALEEVWDLAKNYLLPAVLIENRSIFSVTDTLKSLRNNIPETLVGVFGVDFLGGAFRAPVFILNCGIVAVSCGFAYFLGPWVPSFLTLGVQHSPIFWPPVLVGVFIALTLSNLVTVGTDTVKTIYFTVFYTLLNRPHDLDPLKREELKDFLLQLNQAPSITEPRKKVA